jgi:hypothetical protein
LAWLDLARRGLAWLGLARHVQYGNRPWSQVCARLCGAIDRETVEVCGADRVGCTVYRSRSSLIAQSTMVPAPVYFCVCVCVSLSVCVCAHLLVLINASERGEE